MSGGTSHSSAVSPGGHRTLGYGQHSDNVPGKRAYDVVWWRQTRSAFDSKDMAVIRIVPTTISRLL